ncbi:Phage protein [hydrothermal vent metagenome]|uniref:Phage protein n=1 Tax=hydrothermal vent metagenome TaxID=652676 RepID=A0A3B1E514_9ZZZZ
MAGELLEETIWEMADLQPPQNNNEWNEGDITLLHSDDENDDFEDEDEDFDDEEIEDDDEDDEDEDFDEEDFDEEEDLDEEDDEWGEEEDGFANSKADSYGDSDDDF